MLYHSAALAQGLGGNPSADCINAIKLCASTQIGVQPRSAGNNEFDNPNNIQPTCLPFGSFPEVWFEVNVETAGTFTFEIDPFNDVADYDFAVFGPVTDCDNLGTSIRCSSTNPTAAGVSALTGLNESSTDVVEGPGPNGDGFLRQLDVTPGQTYYIVVALAIGSDGFDMNIGGTTEFDNKPIANDLPDINVCDTTDGMRDRRLQFDFTDLDDAVLDGQTDVSVSYYATLGAANQQIRALTFPYVNAASSQTIYYVARGIGSDCIDINSFELTVDRGRIPDQQQVTVCSLDAIEDFDVADLLPDLLDDLSRYDVSYHDNREDAQQDVNERSSVFQVANMETDVYIRIVDLTGVNCDSQVRVPLVLSRPPELQPLPVFELCDEDADGAVTLRLSDYNDQILSGLDSDEHEVNYYESIDDRLNNRRIRRDFEIAVDFQEIYVRVTNTTTGCFTDTSIDLQINRPPELVSQDPKNICIDSQDIMTLSVATGFAFYEWSTGQSGDNLNAITVSAPGDYVITVTNDNGCTASQTIQVLPSEVARIDSIEINDFQNGNNGIEILVSGFGDYEYSVDDSTYQMDSFFTGLTSGFHVIRVNDRNGCGIVQQEFGILDFQEYFTPNGDGFNDRWTLDAISLYPEAQLFIYDRYGKLIKQLAATSQGWDGTFNNEPMPSSTYWYIVDIPDRPLVKGNFALKR